MRNLIQDGENITIPSPGVVASGDPVLVGNLFGVAVHAAIQGEPLTIRTENVFELPCLPAAVFAVGDPVYFDPAKASCVNASAGKHLIGAATVAAGNGAVLVRVRLNGTSTTVAA